MMGMMGAAPAVRRGARRNARDILSTLGLSAQFAMDAADAQSVISASTQKWLDLSGNGQDFFVGASLSATASDPTQVGAIGSRSKDTYWQFDGDDYLAYDTSLETWMNNVHKAAGKFSGFAWMWFGAENVAQGIMGDQGGVTSNLGFNFYRSGTNKLSFRTGNGTAAAISQSTALSVPGGQWTFCGVSFSEAVGASGLVFQIDGTQEVLSSAASSPSASAAGQNMKIGGFGNASNLLAAGSRMSMAVGTDAVWSAAELMAIYNATKARYA